MKDKLLSPFAMAAIWFGAAVSLAEILTGGLLAGMEPGLAVAAIVAGHLVGGLIFWAVARLSWKSDRGAIAVCADAFGRPGTLLFGGLNALQLLGWTAVMLIVGGDGMGQAARSLGLALPAPYWRAGLGIALGLWLLLGFKQDSLLSKVASLALLALTAVLAALVAGGGLPGLAAAAPVGAPAAPPPDFGAAFELTLIMPLSWLPLVGDYTRPSAARRRACVAAAAAYAMGSCWMYLIGFGAAARIGAADPVAALAAHAGQIGGLAALAVIVLSTVTTAFLDAASAGYSLQAALPRVKARPAALATVLAATALSLVLPMDRYQNFLYAIGSVFAPLYAVVLAHALVARRLAGLSPLARNAAGLAAWAIGLVLYYLIMPVGTPLGLSVPAMAAVAAIYLLFAYGVIIWKRRNATPA